MFFSEFFCLFLFSYGCRHLSYAVPILRSRVWRGVMQVVVFHLFWFPVACFPRLKFTHVYAAQSIPLRALLDKLSAFSTFSAATSFFPRHPFQALFTADGSVNEQCAAVVVAFLLLYLFDFYFIFILFSRALFAILLSTTTTVELKEGRRIVL